MDRLFNGAPKSKLAEMLSEWYEWSPGDERGSKEYANRESIKKAVSAAGLGRTARELWLTMHIPSSDSTLIFYIIIIS